MSARPHAAGTPTGAPTDTAAGTAGDTVIPSSGGDGALVRAKALTKRFGGYVAVDDVDFSVQRGEVFGFLGPNGAGKTTTIRVLLDLLRPTSGSAEVLVVAPTAGGPALRARIGYLPGELSMSGRMTAGGLLGQLARLRGGRGAERIPQLAERFGLDLDRPIRGLSKGNKQKVGVVQAFMHDPELLILDEPTSGLDPLLQHEFQALALEAHARGATIFMSSHVLSEIEDVAERVAIIRAGTLVDVDDVRTLRHRAGQAVELRFAGAVDLADLRDLPGVTELVVDPDHEDTTTVLCQLHGEPDLLLKAAARHHVVHWSAQDRELEDLFLDFYRVPTTHTPPEEVAADDR